MFMATTAVFAMPSAYAPRLPWWHATLWRLGAAFVVALLLSTEFLAQPFIWRYFASDEIISGWLLVMRDRLFVAVAIAVSLSLLNAIAGERGSLGSGLSAIAIILGAATAELALCAIDPQAGRNSVGALFGHVIAWVLVTSGITAMFALWLRSETNKVLNHNSELQRLRTERVLGRLRADALQRQIEPHFLFNTLATIRRLHSSEPVRGRLLLSRFLAFLRGTIDAGHGGYSDVGDELVVASAYLDVCAIRMGGRLRWRIDVPDALHHLPFPRFGLTTLVENAVKHGIAPSRGGGTVEISGDKKAEFLTLCVADTGRGFTDTHGSGTGLANIREQLELCYGPHATLTLASNRPRGVRAIIRVPCEMPS
jgi:LytS/YehU family sensor histidine kinase